MPMRWIGKSVCAGEVWNRDSYHRAILAHSVDLFHRLHNIVQMFDDVVCKNFAKIIGSKRPRSDIQVVDHIGVGIRNHINVDCVRSLFLATA